VPSPLLRAFAQLPEFFQVVSNLENNNPIQRQKPEILGILPSLNDHTDCQPRSFASYFLQSLFHLAPTERDVMLIVQCPRIPSLFELTNSHCVGKPAQHGARSRSTSPARAAPQRKSAKNCCELEHSGKERVGLDPKRSRLSPSLSWSAPPPPPSHHFPEFPTVRTNIVSATASVMTTSLSFRRYAVDFIQEFKL
jgi:hypothetical protein